MEEAIILTYDMSADDSTRIGEASSDVKRKLRQMDVSPDTTREVAVAMYEGGINMIIHARGDIITVEITTEEIKMILADVGPGIPDVKLAMQAGCSTASDRTRSLGFGTGMGLPDMRKYSGSMDTDTRMGEGATITMVVSLQNARMKE